MAQTSSSPLLADIDRAIARIEAEARTLQAQVPTASPVRGAPPPAPAAPGAVEKQAVPAQTPSLEDLTVFLSRLKQMKEWLQEDERLLPIVDDHISQHVRAAEKRTNALNLQLAAITTLVGALLGWLLSSVQGPAALLAHILPH
jgi:hypothetical protein